MKPFLALATATLLALSSACGSGDLEVKLPPAEPALTATAVASRATELSQAAKIGESRALSYYGEGEAPKASGYRVTVTSISTKSLVQDYNVPGGGLGGGKPYPHVVAELRIDNPNKTALPVPDVKLIDPKGKEYGSYAGSYNGPTNIGTVRFVPPGTTLTAAVYVRFGGGGEAGDPPDNFKGWSVKVSTSGAPPPTANTALWVVQ